MVAISFRFPGSLRARMALGVALPLLVALTALSLLHYWRARNLVEDQARRTAEQVGQVILSGLRHSMFANDSDMLQTALADVGAVDSIRRVEIVNVEGRVQYDTAQMEVGRVRQPTDSGCVECHRFAPADRPRTALLQADAGLLRIASPINNEPACASCHPTASAHLGVLLADVPIVLFQQRILRDLQADLAASAAITLVVTLSVYLLVHLLVVRRVEALHRPLEAFSAGDFTARLAAGARPRDELDELTGAFNHMAEELQRNARAERERSELRQKAIVEERERIARELHDGVAQLLGYVNTKAMAARLFLHNRQNAAAEEQLLSLEEVAREVFVDVREAILGLRMAGRAEGDLPSSLKEYAGHFSRMSGLPVEVEVAPEVNGLPLVAEAEVQLLRIVQEALANVRKHSHAPTARVNLRCADHALELTVADDGRGFDPAYSAAAPRSHFGLETMRERAEAIGAEFLLDSSPGAGTRVTVRLPLNGK